MKSQRIFLPLAWIADKVVLRAAAGPHRLKPRFNRRHLRHD
jgi:hypothetical protein